MTVAAHLRALIAKATPGPWRSRTHQQRKYRYVEFDNDGYTTSALEPADADLIVALRNAAPEIADLIEALNSTPAIRAFPELTKALAAVEARLGEPA